jgi:hypothetical protein
VLGALFADAGAASVRMETHHGTARFPSIRTMVEADLLGWLPMWGVILSGSQVEEILLEADRRLGAYATRDGGVMFDSSAHLVTARKQ